MGSFMENLLNIPYKNASFFVENYAKIYPNRISLFVPAIPYTKLQDGMEKTRSEIKLSTKSTTPETPFWRSIRRTKTLISDIVLCNDFQLFATFTFAKDRQDIGRCKSKMSNWLQSQQKQYGSFSYLIVPEFHKDGKSLHFHALLKDYKGNLHKTKIRQSNRTIYNIKSYRSGFSTAVKIDDHQKVASYIKKYITKDMPFLPGQKRYWVSKGLLRPVVVYNTDIHSDYSLIHETENYKLYQSPL